ncbi:MAG: heme biosynthesis protein HemY [Gammaproteobacteria bacterium]|nr:heme biosynthesis protein HemY [Gammaproteobacteria bacterium]
MRTLFVFLAVMLVSVALTLLLREENGYFLLGYGVWTIEGSLALFVLSVLGLFFIAYGLIRGLAGLWSAPASVRDWRVQRQLRRARLSLTKGLIELAEGNWQAAEKDLLRHAEHSDMPVINYLAAARVAQRQGAEERRDEYLRLAHESLPTADLAVGLIQAELHLSHQQREQALATLNHLNSTAPGQPQVLRLHSQVLLQLKDWPAMVELLPSLRKHKVLESTEFYRLEVQLQRYLLEQVAGRGGKGPLRHVWENMSRTLQREPELVALYVQLQLAAGSGEEMERLLRDALEQEWDERLVGLYGRLPSAEPLKLLAQGENWLQQRPRDPVLLLALGRLALRGRLWGKARTYLEACIGLTESAEAYRELGSLLEGLDEQEAARNCYRKGLELATQGSSLSPLPAPTKLGGSLEARPEAATAVAVEA